MQMTVIFSGNAGAEGVVTPFIVCIVLSVLFSTFLSRNLNFLIFTILIFLYLGIISIK